MQRLTPIKAIRAKCLDCCADQIVEVRLCGDDSCPLWPYRMGHRPKDGQEPVEEDGDEKTSDSTGFSEKEGLSDG